jgi:hypothetical protein
MAEDPPSPFLGATGNVYVTLRAAREYAAATSLGEEEARRALTELLLDARPQGERPPYESWRRRKRLAGRKLDVSAMVSREGPLAVVITVEVHGGGDRG